MGNFLLYFFASLVLLNYFLIPKHHFRQLFPIALSIGLGSEIVAILLFSKLLHLFDYVNLGSYGVKGFPIFMILSWIVFIIFYLEFSPQSQSWPSLIVYTAFFVILTHFLRELVEHQKLIEHHFKYFAYLAFAGNFSRYIIAYLVYKSNFFNRGLGNNND